MNNFQIFANHRILDSNLHYCLYVTDDLIPANDTVIRSSCQSSPLTPAGHCQFGIIVHTMTPNSTELSPTHTNQPSYTREMSLYNNVI